MSASHMSASQADTLNQCMQELDRALRDRGGPIRLCPISSRQIQAEVTARLASVRLRVLYVEPDWDTRALTSGEMVRREFSVRAVDSAEAALEALRAEPYDVIVTDLHLSGMDGVQLLVVARERWPAMGRVVLSALGIVPVATLQRAVNHGGVYGWLTKPADPEEMGRLLREVAARRGDG